MKRLIAVSFALLGACDAGSVGDDVVGDDAIEDEITCMSEVSISGSLTPGDPRPAEIGGCWAVGTWTFSATVVTNTCSAPPTLLGSYGFRVDRDLAAPDPNYAFLYTITSPASDPTAEVGVTSGGAGDCSGSFQVYSADGLTLTNLHPSLYADNTIMGIGTVEVHTVDQRPAPQ